MSPTLLLDADITAFQIAAVSQQTFQFEGCEPSTVVDDWSEVTPRIDHAVEKLMDQLDTDKVIVCLSCPSAENWRLEYLPTYKANRAGLARPVHLQAVKDYMAANWPSFRRPTLEADDILGILSTDTSGIVKGHRIIVSEDKDLKTIPGWLFNPAKDEFPREVSVAEADRWHLWQTICGDTVDGYTGCVGAAAEKAGIVLENNGLYVPCYHVLKSGPRKGQEETRWRIDTRTAASDWERVVALYERYGQTEADALVQARVSRICRASDYDFQNKKVIPWTPASLPRPVAMTA